MHIYKIMCTFVSEYGKENMLFSHRIIVWEYGILSDTQDGASRHRGPLL